MLQSLFCNLLISNVLLCFGEAQVKPFPVSLVEPVAYLKSELRTIIGVAQVTVEVRTDPWFIRDETFPIVSPYVNAGKPPTREAYEHSQQWSCIANSEGVQCFSSGADLK
ncbi:MAG: hypothetical protein DMG36_25880 [Acidobacteria bacterium]|nr:MAG: hypothetical protein DMG36_25880 [Acidobacteriota bacterium]